MRSLVIGLVLAASLSLPGLAAEPEGPAALIDRTDAIKIAVQLVRIERRRAIVEHRAADDQRHPPQRTRSRKSGSNQKNVIL